MTSLPPLRQHPSPNVSDRLHGIVPYLIVLHRPVGGFDGAERTLCDPAAQVSAHILTDSNREAVQLVAFDHKAWACASFNSVSYNLEIDDHAWSGEDHPARATAARIAAYICHKTGIPARWSHLPTAAAGLVRHYDLGTAGGGHTDPTTDDANWRGFVAMVKTEVERGGFRPSWGKGTLQRIDA